MSWTLVFGRQIVPGRRRDVSRCLHLHFVVQLLDAAVLARHGEIGALQKGLASRHVAVDLGEVHVESKNTQI